MSLNVLAFFAHPDDETMLCGGTLALLARLGARVHITIATRGEGGEMGEPPLCEREALGRLREDELRCAAQALGAASLTIMDYLDPTIGPENVLFPFTDNLDCLASEVVEAVRYRAADVILSHGVNGEYGHPAHVLAHDAVRLAVHALAEDAPLFYTSQAAYEGHPMPLLANKDAPAQMVIDTTAVLAEKTAAAMCHRSQHALFVRKHSEEQGRVLSVPEVIMIEESLHRVSPPHDGLTRLDDPFANLLWSSGFALLPRGA